MSSLFDRDAQVGSDVGQNTHHDKLGYPQPQGAECQRNQTFFHGGVFGTDIVSVILRAKIENLPYNLNLTLTDKTDK